MPWTVSFHEDFDPEFAALGKPVRIELAAMIEQLETRGPQLARPYADTLSGSRHANMKELRFQADGGVWRVAFAFDPVRRAILLVAGNKGGVSQQRFYKSLIAKADRRYDGHLATAIKLKE